MNGNCWFLNPKQNICSFAESLAKIEKQSQVGVEWLGKTVCILAVPLDLLLAFSVIASSRIFRCLTQTAFCGGILLDLNLLQSYSICKCIWEVPWKVPICRVNFKLNTIHEFSLNHSLCNLAWLNIWEVKTSQWRKRRMEMK